MLARADRAGAYAARPGPERFSSLRGPRRHGAGRTHAECANGHAKMRFRRRGAAHPLPRDVEWRRVAGPVVTPQPLGRAPLRARTRPPVATAGVRPARTSTLPMRPRLTASCSMALAQADAQRLHIWLTVGRRGGQASSNPGQPDGRWLANLNTYWRALTAGIMTTASERGCFTPEFTDRDPRPLSHRGLLQDCAEGRISLRPRSPVVAPGRQGLLDLILQIDGELVAQ